MQLKKKKIELLYCGSLPLKERDRNVQGLKKWLETMPELILVAEIKPKFFVFKADDPQSEFSQWQELAQYIYQNHQKYDGFIVVNYIDRLQNGAIALSFMLSGFTKPVIFTAGPVLSSVLRKNNRIQDVLNNYEFLSLRTNVINSLQVVNYEVPEISLIFGNRLIKAVKSISGADNTVIFDSIDEPLGRVAFSINVNKKAIKKKTIQLELRTAINQNVVCLKVYPGFSAQIVENLSATKDGIVLDFNHQGIAIEGLEKIQTNNKAIVLYNQPWFRQDKKFIEVSHILPHVLAIKLMWALGQTREIRRLRKLLFTDMCGEFLK